MIAAERGNIVFHSLRHTFGSMLASSGVHPKTAMELLRHSDINLTLSRYTHSYRGATAAAVNTLPDLGKLPESQSQVKNGTDSNSVSAVCSDKLCIKNEKKPETTGIMGIVQDEGKTTLLHEKSSSQCENNNGRYRTRTCGLLLVRQIWQNR